MFICYIILYIILICDTVPYIVLLYMRYEDMRHYHIYPRQSGKPPPVNTRGGAYHTILPMYICYFPILSNPEYAQLTHFILYFIISHIF